MFVFLEIQNLDGVHDRGEWVTEVRGRSLPEIHPCVRANPSERLNETISVAKAKLITKILRHHQAMNATVHDADANASEVFLKNVGAMAGRMH